MCEKYCANFETFNPEVEYRKYLQRKPVIETAKLYENLSRHPEIKCPYNFKGYGVETAKDFVYRTCSSDYGFYPPNAYTIPSRLYPLPQKFSNNLARFGMYRNFSLNTYVDRRWS